LALVPVLPAFPLGAEAELAAEPVPESFSLGLVIRLPMLVGVARAVLGPEIVGIEPVGNAVSVRIGGEIVESVAVLVRVNANPVTLPLRSFFRNGRHRGQTSGEEQQDE
jgi:hypothetical protein